MIRSMVRRLSEDRKGVAAIEFALLAIPLFMVIMGGIEFGFMMFTKARLGGTLQQAARMATTGDVDKNGIDGSRIDDMVKADLKVTQEARVDIEKAFYDRFDQVGKPEEKDTAGTSPPYCWIDINGNQQWDANPGRKGLGGANDIINYKVTVKYPALFPLITNTVTGSPEIVLTEQASLQNEPFGGGQDQTEKRCCVSAAAGNPVTCTAT